MTWDNLMSSIGKMTRHWVRHQHKSEDVPENEWLHVSFYVRVDGDAVAFDDMVVTGKNASGWRMGSNR